MEILEKKVKQFDGCGGMMGFDHLKKEIEKWKKDNQTKEKELKSLKEKLREETIKTKLLE